MKPLAIFTIARNESFFLPLWTSYYEKVGADLYVLDHESTDGSTNSPLFHRKLIHRQKTDDVAWMLRTVTDFQHELLKSYSAVVFTEVDEFLIPHPESHQSLASYLAAWYLTTDHVATATGYDVCQRPGGELLNLDKPILSQRGWKRNPRYDKTLISISPLEWEVGFHRLKGIREGADNHHPDPALMLVHLHWMDREIAWNRLVKRMEGREPEPGGWGIQNKTRDRGEFDALFDRETEGAVEIPAELRNLL